MSSDAYDRGVASERTSLAWTRTSLSFAALGAFAARLLIDHGVVVTASVAVFALAGAAGAYVHGRRSYAGRHVRTQHAPVALVRAVAVATATIAIVACVAAFY